ncbi:MAG: HAD family phosphatase [Synergistaceae bacterium]|nr:HAD family phosphatase [Synergistaceae bacterium]
MSEIKLIAFDLDDTLFNSNKDISQANMDALERAAKMGIELVPTTGRFWSIVHEKLRNSGLIHYAITLNGAEIFDVRQNKSIAKFEIPFYRAALMSRVFDEIPGIAYDCVINSQGYMRRDFYETAKDFTIGEWQYIMIKTSRKTVDNMSEFLLTQKMGVQKMLILTLDNKLRLDLLHSLPAVFPHNLFTTSVPNNIEINDLNANKGGALKFLAEYLKLDIKSTMAFGDGTNDISMIQAAGIGVAMKNACQEALNIADYITDSCDNDGVAKGIQKFCL